MKSQSKFIHFIHENAFENVVCEMAAILSWPQCVKCFSITWYCIWRLQWPRQNTNQILNLQMTPYTSPSSPNYRVSTVKILEKIDHIIMALHCTLKQAPCENIIDRPYADSCCIHVVSALQYKTYMRVHYSYMCPDLWQRYTLLWSPSGITAQLYAYWALSSWEDKPIDQKETGGLMTTTIVSLYTCYIIWVRSWRCGCLVTWFCYHLIAKPGNKKATSLWPDPLVHITPAAVKSAWWLLLCWWPGAVWHQSISNQHDDAGLSKYIRNALAGWWKHHREDFLEPAAC